jgi:hypothetical protein
VCVEGRAEQPEHKSYKFNSSLRNQYAGYQVKTLSSSRFHPSSRIAPHLQPRAVFVDVAVAPAHLHVAEYTLGVGHEGSEAAVWRGDGSEAAGAAVGVERILLGGCAEVVYEAHRGDGFGCIASLAEICEAFAVGYGNRQSAAFHVFEKQRG